MIRVGFGIVLGLALLRIAWWRSQLLGELPNVGASALQLLVTTHSRLIVFNAVCVVAVVPLIRAFGNAGLAVLELPHKEYWFHGERRAASFAWLTDAVLGFGIVTIGFELAMMELSLADVGHRVVPINPRYGMLLLYIVFTGSMMMAARRRFSAPPGDEASD